MHPICQTGQKDYFPLSFTQAFLQERAPEGGKSGADAPPPNPAPPPPPISERTALQQRRAGATTGDANPVAASSDESDSEP